VQPGAGWERNGSERRRSQDAGEKPVSGNSGRGTKRIGGASRRFSSRAAPQWSGVSGLNLRSQAPVGECEAARAETGAVLRDGEAFFNEADLKLRRGASRTSCQTF